MGIKKIKIVPAVTGVSSENVRGDRLLKGLSKQTPPRVIYDKDYKALGIENDVYEEGADKPYDVHAAPLIRVNQPRVESGSSSKTAADILEELRPLYDRAKEDVKAVAEEASEPGTIVVAHPTPDEKTLKINTGHGENDYYHNADLLVYNPSYNMPAFANLGEDVNYTTFSPRYFTEKELPLTYAAYKDYADLFDDPRQLAGFISSLASNREVIPWLRYEGGGAIAHPAFFDLFISKKVRDLLNGKTRDDVKRIFPAFPNYENAPAVLSSVQKFFPKAYYQYGPPPVTLDVNSGKAFFTRPVSEDRSMIGKPTRIFEPDSGVVFSTHTPERLFSKYLRRIMGFDPVFGDAQLSKGDEILRDIILGPGDGEFDVDTGAVVKADPTTFSIPQLAAALSYFFGRLRDPNALFTEGGNSLPVSSLSNFGNSLAQSDIWRVLLSYLIKTADASQKARTVQRQVSGSTFLPEEE